MVAKRSLLAGFLFALAAGTLWGTTGPLSTALYEEGAQLTAVGFWRVLVSVVALGGYALIASRSLFRMDRRGLLLVVLAGGTLVAVFEVAFQYAIAGIGVAGAVVMLYTAPVLVTLLAKPLLGERATPGRIAMAAVVLAGVYMTVTGNPEHSPTTAENAGRTAGMVGGGLAAISYAGMTLLARWSVPRYGAVRVLFWELLGGVVVLGVLLPLFGNAPEPPDSAAGWLYIFGLGAGAVLAANFFYFAALRRIAAGPAAVGASIEPVVGALLALALFGQKLTTAGWLGLAVVIAGVAGGYWFEARANGEAQSAQA